MAGFKEALDIGVGEVQRDSRPYGGFKVILVSSYQVVIANDSRMVRKWTHAKLGKVESWKPDHPQVFSLCPKNRGI